MAPITINGITFDPVADAQPMRALSLEAKDAADSNFILVGITGSGTTSVEQDAELEKLGLRLHGYVAPGTYLFKYEASDLEAVRKLDFVDWANVYMKNWKVNPALRSRQSSNAGDQTRLLTLAMSPARSSSRDKQQVDAVLHKGVVANSEASVRRRDSLTISRRSMRFEPSYLLRSRSCTTMSLEISSAPTWISTEHSFKAKERLSALQIQASIADSRIQQGCIQRLYDLGGRGKASDPDGHGTHVAGSVLGDGFSANMGGPIQGTAPQATLVFQSAYQTSDNSLGGLPADLNDLFQPSYDHDHARIHTNSWGFGVDKDGRQRPYGFSSAAFEVDEFVWEHQDMVICFAAGNEGTDAKRPDGISDDRQIGAASAA